MHGPLPEARQESRIERFRRAMIDPHTSGVHYWAALAIVGLLASLAWGLYPGLAGRASFLIFIPGLLLAAGFGGIGPGLVATVVSAALGIVLAGQGGISAPVLIEGVVPRL